MEDGSKWAGVNQPVHWFLGGKNLDIQQEMSVWVGSPYLEQVDDPMPRNVGNLSSNNACDHVTHEVAFPDWRRG